MNLFYALTVTESLLAIDVVWHPEPTADHGIVRINGQECAHREDITIYADIVIETENAWIDSITVDHIAVHNFLPTPDSCSLTVRIPGPFYRWWHQRSGQGWLIYPAD